jgi:hypothetical protein
MEHGLVPGLPPELRRVVRATVWLRFDKASWALLFTAATTSLSGPLERRDELFARVAAGSLGL